MLSFCHLAGIDPYVPLQTFGLLHAYLLSCAMRKSIKQKQNSKNHRMQQIKTLISLPLLLSASFPFLCKACSQLEALLAMLFFIPSLESFFEMHSAILNSPTKLYFNYFPRVLY